MTENRPWDNTDNRSPADLAREAIDLLYPDRQRIEQGRRRQEAVWLWREASELPILLGSRRERPDTDDPYPYRRFDHHEQFYDPDKMLVEAVWALLDGQGNPNARGDSQLAIRANLGTVVVATTFGLKARPLPHTPPWIVHHLTREQAAKAIQELDPATAPQRGLAAEALERSAYFCRQLGNKARVYGINNQSPLDIAHQVRGEDLFYDLYDDPAFVHDLLEACTQAYIAVGRAFKQVLDEPADCSYSGASYRVQCGVHAADDSATLLRPDHFAEFALPYDRKAFEPFGGGSIHFCGNAQHILDGYLAAPEVKAINLGQPELYDPAELMPQLIAAKKVFVGKWTVHPGESLDDYVRRILDAMGHRQEGMLLSLAGWEFGIPPEQVSSRWYACQREQ